MWFSDGIRFITFWTFQSSSSPLPSVHVGVAMSWFRYNAHLESGESGLEPDPTLSVDETNGRGQGGYLRMRINVARDHSIIAFIQKQTWQKTTNGPTDDHAGV